MKKIITIILLLIYIPLIVLANDLTFCHLNKRNGLSQNTVFAFLQDHQGFMWIGTKHGLNRYDGTNIKKYFRGNHTYNLGSDLITALWESPSGRLWVATDIGIFIYEPSTDSFSRFSQKAQNGKSIYGRVSFFYNDNNVLYIGTYHEGIFAYDYSSGKLINWSFPKFSIIRSMYKFASTFYVGTSDNLYWTKNLSKGLTPVKDSKGLMLYDGEEVSAISYGEGGIYVCSGHSGFSLYNVHNCTKTIIISKDNGRDIYARTMIRAEGKIWIASEEGLFTYNIGNKHIIHTKYSPYDSSSLSDSSLYTLYEGRNGTIWVGSFFGGADYLLPTYNNFTLYYSGHNIHGDFRGIRIRNIAPSTNNRLWIGTEDQGLNLYDTKTGLSRFVESSTNFPNIEAVLQNGTDVYVGTFSYGFHIIDATTMKVKDSFYKSNAPGAIRENSVRSLYKLLNGMILVGTDNGLMYFNPKNKTFTYVHGLEKGYIIDIRVDSKGDLWILTTTDGVYRLTPAGKRFQYGIDKPKKGLPTDNIIGFMDDRNGNIWISTVGYGVFRFNRSKDYFYNVPIPRSNYEKVVYRMEEDVDGTMWLSTNNGLIHYNPKTSLTRVYTTKDGLLDDQYNYASSYRFKNGNIYFGGLHGFISFNSQAYIHSDENPHLLVTDLLINNISIDRFSENSPIDSNIVVKKTLRLPLSQNSFSLRLTSPMQTRTHPIEYRLLGYDRQWIPLYENGYATFTHLASGHYILQARMLMKNGEWNETALNFPIEIVPPFYLSRWAKILYIILSIFLLFLLWRNYIYRVNMKHQLEIEAFEREKEKELYQSKHHFFTNVAHEIRTPLTLISGPIEEIMNSERILDSDVNCDLEIVSKNVKLLLKLVNKLLDFNKIENTINILNFESCNINKILQEKYELFLITIRQRGIFSSFLVPEKDLIAQVDYEAFNKIVMNLIDNAVKYSSGKISICLDSDNKNFFIRVINDGKIIPQSFHKQVFQPFFRLDSSIQSDVLGSGIGLPMARTLAELHGGTLVIVPSSDCNEFLLSLPIKQQSIINLKENAESETLKKMASEGQNPNWETTILVVEDNINMLEYERRKLSEYYNVLTATSGEVALKIMNDNVKLIITDVMMEPIDGFELCFKIKNDFNFSHIPIILLSAVTMNKAKIKGLHVGADAYIEKPFSMDALLAKVQEFLGKREDMRPEYATFPLSSSEELIVSEADAKFVERLKEIRLISQNGC